MFKAIWTLLLAISLTTPLAAGKLAYDDHVIALLEPTAQGFSAVGQVFGDVKPVGGEYVLENEAGYWRFGDAPDNSIILPDNGKIKLGDGFSVEADLFLEKPLETEAVFVDKAGVKLKLTKENKFDITYIWHENEPRERAGEKYWKSLPVSPQLSAEGRQPLPTGEWIRLAFTYDMGKGTTNKSLVTATTWINGGKDRQKRDQTVTPLVENHKQPFVLLKGVKNCRVGAIRVSDIPRRLEPLPPALVFVNQLRWQNKILVTLDDFALNVPLPLELVLSYHGMDFNTPLCYPPIRKKLASRERISVEMPLASIFKPSLNYIRIQLFSGERQLLDESRMVVNAAPPQGSCQIGSDRTISYNGRAMFPRRIIGVFAEDFPVVAKLGFTHVSPRDPTWKMFGCEGVGKAYEDIYVKLLENAAKDNIRLGLPVGARFAERLQDNPGLGDWSNFDEPWAYFDFLRQRYSMMVLLGPNAPVLGAQCFKGLMREAAECADILLVDPYPSPYGALRYVYDLTKLGIDGSFGRKPVITVLNCYGYGPLSRKADHKVPTLDEYRCMLYMAVAAGANGVGIYSWDERTKNPGERGCYYTKEYPEVMAMHKTVNDEIIKLESVLVRPNTGEELKVTPAYDGFRSCVKELGGKKYLIFATDSGTTDKLVIEYPPAADRAARPLADGNFKQDLVFKAGKAAVILPPVASGVFELP